jgi:hypothetical protein
MNRAEFWHHTGCEANAALVVDHSLAGVLVVHLRLASNGSQ